MENNTEEMVKSEQEAASETAPAAVENPAQEKNEGNLLSDIFEIVESTLIAVFVMMMVITYLLHPVNINGHSMVPTLNKYYDSEDVQDKILMAMVYTDVKYGDIIVIDNDANYLLDENGEAYVPDQRMQSTLNQCIIKRVIACGGQTIDIRDNKVTVDGNVIDEPYIAAGSTTNDLGAFTGQYPITIPEGYYFVMGDNRNGSTDSRDSHVGLISRKQIYGKAIVRYYPLKNFKFLFNSWKESAND